MTARNSLILATALCAAAAPALAALPAGTNSGDLVTSSGDATTFFTTTHQNNLPAGTFSQTLPAGTASASASVSALDTPTPLIHSTVSASVGAPATVGSASASSDSFTHYSFMILGSGDAAVTIAASGGVGYTFETGGSGQAHAAFHVQELNNPSLVVGEDLFLDGAGSGCVDLSNPHVTAPGCALSFAVNSDFLLHTNTEYDVLLDTSIGVSAGSNLGAGTNSGFADVDPTFSVHGPFTIVLSDGFGGGINLPGPGGAAPAPEPAAWAMMLLGFAAIGGAARRVRRVRRARRLRAA